MEERENRHGNRPRMRNESKTRGSGGDTGPHGQTYYFYAPGCRDVFDTDPDKYLSRATEPPKKQGVWAKLFKRS